MDIFIYVLSNEINSNLYVGITNNLKKRLSEHNRGAGKYTKAYMPWKLIYSEIAVNYATARVREKYLKSNAGKRFLQSHFESQTDIDNT